MYYVYRITNIRLNKHYYGSRVANKAKLEDLGTKYYSSTVDKSFIKDQKENPQDYKYKVVKIFDNKEDCIKFESKLHFKFDVKNHPSFYNKANQKMTGFDFQETIECEHCGEIINKGNYVRWHGDNCYILKNIEYQLNHIPYMKKLLHKKTNIIGYVDTRSYNPELFTETLNNAVKIYKEDNIIHISKENYDSIKHKHINSKTYYILDNKNEIVEIFNNFKNINIKYPKNLFYESYNFETSITFYHETSQYNKAKKYNLLKYEGWKLLSEIQYFNNIYNIFDKNRINKILNGRNNIIFEIYDSDNKLIKIYP